RYPGAAVAMETGTHSPWVSRLLTALGHPVIVANARKLRAISQSQTKSDREDAQMLARLGRADPKLLSPVRHRREETQRALVRLKVREALVRSRIPHRLPVWLKIKWIGFPGFGPKSLRGSDGIGGDEHLQPARHFLVRCRLVHGQRQDTRHDRACHQ
ncbi:MAG: transposase, partial [Opitutaceae bacterium]